MRLLIITPHFPPTNAPDLHRVRTVLPFLGQNGWDAHVLAVQPAQVAAPIDPWLVDLMPSDIPVHRVQALGLRWTRLPGLGSLAFRAMPALRRCGDRLLASNRFDLVYFSTTQFGVHSLGPFWLRKFGVPFAMDYQDPWVNEYYSQHLHVVPPGGRFKFALAQMIHRRAEPRVLRHCAGITSVSPEYPFQLRSRYSFLPPQWPVEVLPFPGNDHDLERAATVRQRVFTPTPGMTNWVCVGRAGPDMHLAAQSLFDAVRAYARDWPGFLRRLRIHLIGTSYAPNGRAEKSIEPLAAAYGLAGVVREDPERIPYSQALRCLIDASALIALGSDDPAYTASKIYPYLLARKPLLAVFHENSSVTSLLRAVQGGICVAFRTDESVASISARIRRQWFDQNQWMIPRPLNEAAFGRFRAAASTERLAAFFHRCVRYHRVLSGHEPIHQAGPSHPAARVQPHPECR